MNVPPEVAQGDSTLGSMPAILALVHRARVGVILIFVVVLGSALAFALSWPKTYRAQVVMSIVTPESGGLGGLLGQFGGLASLAGMGGLSLGRSNTTEPVAVLSSREFAARFIQENDLMPTLFPRRWDAEAKRWKSDDPRKIPTLGDGVKKFTGSVRRVNIDEETGLVVLTVDWRDREKAARWANAMVARANREMRERAIAEAQKSIEYLNAEAAKSDVQPLRDAIYRVVETQVKTIMLARVREDYAFRVIDPAMVPDANKHHWPRGSIVMGVALLVAMLLATLWVCGTYLLDRVRQGYRDSIGLRR